MFGGVGGVGEASEAHQNLEGGVSFKFNFAVEDGGLCEEEEDKGERAHDESEHRHLLDASTAATATTTTATTTTTTTKDAAPAFEVFPKPFDVSKLQLDAVDLGLPSGPIFKVRPSPPPTAVDSDPFSSSALTAHSDLIPGVYEGGFKLWEGAVDLARLLISAMGGGEGEEEEEEGAGEEEEEEVEEEDEGAAAGAGTAATRKPPSSSFVPLDKHVPRWLPGEEQEACRSLLRSLLLPGPRGKGEAAADAAAADADADDDAASGSRPRILELGCGSALPSLVAARMMITAMMNNNKKNKKKNKKNEDKENGPALSVTLCDFNAEVLESCTAANVAANFVRGGGGGEGAEDERAKPRKEVPSFRYFAGDWSNLRNALASAGALSSPSSDSPSSSSSSSSSSEHQEGFDLILAAEVTYNPSSYAALADAIAALLSPPPPCAAAAAGEGEGEGERSRPLAAAALVAAKRYYFGVGGDVAGFCRAVEEAGKLRVRRVAEVVDGPLPRDVLMLTRIR